jgi:hypothetical protein
VESDIGAAGRATRKQECRRAVKSRHTRLGNEMTGTQRFDWPQATAVGGAQRSMTEKTFRDILLQNFPDTTAGAAARG